MIQDVESYVVAFVREFEVKIKLTSRDQGEINRKMFEELKNVSNK